VSDPDRSLAPRERLRKKAAPGTCPRPQKLRFATQVVAEAVAAGVGAKRDITLYVYPCRCGWWHLTKKAPSQLAA
jgi:hypothetical protein